MNITDVIIFCPGCGEKSHAALYAVYIHEDGRQFPHCLCACCAAEAARSEAGHARVSDCVETYFTERGRA